MSFDIHYQTCNFDTRVMKRNRITGKMQSVAVADALSAAEREAVLRVLIDGGAARPKDLGNSVDYVVNLPDGGLIDVSAIEAEGTRSWAGLLVSVRALTTATAELLWNLCRAGGMAAVPMFKDRRQLVLVASEDCRVRAGARWSTPTVVESPDEFYRLLCSEPALGRSADEGVDESASRPWVGPGGKTSADPFRDRAIGAACSYSTGTSKLDLKAEAAVIRNYIASRVEEFDQSARHGPGTASTVKMVYAGFEFDQAGWFVLVFDRRPDASDDGEWTRFIDGNMLGRREWAEAHWRNARRPVRVCDDQGQIRVVSAGTDFGPLLGQMLVGVLERAARDGLFDKLPCADGFHLGLGEFNGSFGWDSLTG